MNAKPVLYSPDVEQVHDHEQSTIAESISTYDAILECIAKHYGDAAHAVLHGGHLWTGIVAHRPLGNVNRGRQDTFRHSADYRARANGCPYHEPGSRL